LAMAASPFSMQLRRCCAAVLDSPVTEFPWDNPHWIYYDKLYWQPANVSLSGLLGTSTIMKTGGNSPPESSLARQAFARARAALPACFRLEQMSLRCDPPPPK
jgi:hypothetical protein